MLALIVGFATALLWIVPQEAARTEAATVPNGTRIHAELNDSLWSGSAKLDDTVKLTVLDDVKGPDGALLIPKGAKLTGRVTLAQKRSDQAPQALLSFVVERAEWRNKSAALRAYVVTLERVGVNVMGSAAEPGPSDTSVGSTRPALEQPPWMRPGTASRMTRDSVPVPKDCGLEKAEDPVIVSVIVCDEQQVALGPGARFILRHRPAP